MYFISFCLLFPLWSQALPSRVCDANIQWYLLFVWSTPPTCHSPSPHTFYVSPYTARCRVPPFLQPPSYLSDRLIYLQADPRPQLVYGWGFEPAAATNLRPLATGINRQSPQLGGAPSAATALPSSPPISPLIFLNSSRRTTPLSDSITYEVHFTHLYSTDTRVSYHIGYYEHIANTSYTHIQAI